MRVGVLGGFERRQRWSQDDKARIVEETLIPGAKVTDIARRNGVAANLSHCWHFADVQGPLCVRSCPLSDSKLRLPLYSQKRTQHELRGMSEKCYTRKRPLLDQLDRAGEQ
jgi:hypothetical protein